jgi:hypothetical protein
VEGGSGGDGEVCGGARGEVDCGDGWGGGFGFVGGVGCGAVGGRRVVTFFEGVVCFDELGVTVPFPTPCPPAPAVLPSAAVLPLLGGQSPETSKR